MMTLTCYLGGADGVQVRSTWNDVGDMCGYVRYQISSNALTDSTKWVVEGATPEQLVALEAVPDLTFIVPSTRSPYGRQIGAVN